MSVKLFSGGCFRERSLIMRNSRVYLAVKWSRFSTGLTFSKSESIYINIFSYYLILYPVSHKTNLALTASTRLQPTINSTVLASSAHSVHSHANMVDRVSLPSTRWSDENDWGGLFALWIRFAYKLPAKGVQTKLERVFHFLHFFHSLNTKSFENF